MAGSDSLSVRVIAPAKLNLYLHIEGRRADGYHLVDSLIAFAEIGDDVRVAVADAVTLSAAGPFAGQLPATADNLVLQAAHRLRDAAGAKGGAAIHLTKNLPVAAGIGGGSADAGAVLRALAALWRLDAAAPVISAIARDLGADVPVCLDGRPSLVAGIGDTIVATPALPAVALVLVNPGVALPTADVFRRFAGTGSPSGRDVREDAWRDVTDAVSLADRLAATGNDLEETAIALLPDIAVVLGALRATPGNLFARMSGSGSTCFAFFADAATAQAAAAALRAEHPAWWIAESRLRSVPAALETG